MTIPGSLKAGDYIIRAEIIGQFPSLRFIKPFLIKSETQASMSPKFPTVQTAPAARNVSPPMVQSRKGTFVNTDGRFKSILPAPRSLSPLVDRLSRLRISTSSEVTSLPTLVSPLTCTRNPPLYPTQLPGLLYGADKSQIW